MNLIDERLPEALRLKFQLGLFDNPYVKDPAAADAIVHTVENQKLSLRAAHEAIVLLKNTRL